MVSETRQEVFIVAGLADDVRRAYDFVGDSQRVVDECVLRIRSAYKHSQVKGVESD